MIESRYWRKELRADLAWLRQRRTFRRWSEKQQVLFERRLMVAAFQIRVLLDRPKVSSTARGAHLNARLYRKVGAQPVTLLNAVALEEHFDLESPRQIRLPIREVCNQLIHHYVLFALRSSRRRFEVLLVFSDYRKHVGLYEIDLPELLDLFALFADDQSAADYVSMTWNEKKQDYVFSTERIPDISSRVT
jgi:hypothetical protein